MLTLFLPPFERTSSVIGFGCASLGSRISARHGYEALGRAYDAGVTWYDVAPSYGDAEAENILGRFARSRRDRIFICSKVGILPARKPLAVRIAKPLARAIVEAAPGLRQAVSRARPQAQTIRLDAKLLTASLDASLKRLKTDYLDVLALHGAHIEDVVRGDILDALEDVMRAGKIRSASIASSAESCVAGANTSYLYGFLQVENNPFSPGVRLTAERISRVPKPTFITHTVFGKDGIARLATRFHADARFREQLASLGYEGNAAVAVPAAMLDHALASNRSGVTLLSMFSPAHLAFNLERVAKRMQRADDRTAMLERVLAG